LIQFTAVVLGALLIMQFFPETTVAQFLHKHLVKRPTIWFAKLQRHDVLFALLLIGLLLLGGEYIAVLGTGDLLLIYAMDLALYTDALIAVSTIAAATKIKSGIAPVMAYLSLWRSRIARQSKAVSHRREHKTQSSSPPAANDDDHAPFGAKLAA
jgi:hypothetical protein